MKWSSLISLNQFELQPVRRARAAKRLLWLCGLLLPLVVVTLAILTGSAKPADTILGRAFRVLLSRTDWMEVLALLVPVLLCGLSVTIPRRLGIWNVGAEGQFLMGATLGTMFASWTVSLGLPGAALLSPVAAFLAGGFLCLIVVWLKTARGVDEVVVFLLLNFAVAHFVGALVEGPLRDPATQWIQSAPIPLSARIPRFSGFGRVTYGLPITLLVSLAFIWLQQRSYWGVATRLIGEGVGVLGYSGKPERPVVWTCAILSGGLAGLAGWFEAAGTQFRLVQDLSPGYGYYAIIIAAFARGNLVFAAGLSIVLAFMINTIDTLTRFASVPIYLKDLFLGGCLIGYVLARAFVSGAMRSRS